MNKIKCKNIWVIEVPKGEQEVEEVFEEIMMENTPHLVKERDIKPFLAQRDPKPRNLSLIHI